MMRIRSTLWCESVLGLGLLLLFAGAIKAQASSPPPASTTESQASPETAAGNQSRTTAAKSKAPPPPEAPATSDFLSSNELIISAMVIAVALIALVMEFFLMRKISTLKAEDALRLFAVTLIITGTLFLIAVGFDSKEIAPAMGLFGTVAGYLLGRSADRKDAKDNV